MTKTQTTRFWHKHQFVVARALGHLKTITGKGLSKERKLRRLQEATGRLPAHGVAVQVEHRKGTRLPRPSTGEPPSKNRRAFMVRRHAERRGKASGTRAATPKLAPA